VLVDTPPCLEFDGARNLARYADGLVLVVRANYTDLRTAQAAVERFEDDGTRVTGIILNRWNPFPRDMALPRFSRRAGQIGNLGYDLSRRV
jgi:Mrp family chromosome partitioning ATPase